MAGTFTLPLGEYDYSLTATLGDSEYGLRLRFNMRDGRWYLDLADADGEPIVTGVRCVLGVKLGGRSAHPFFVENILILRDTSKTNAEAGIDDLGRRVLLEWIGPDDLAALVAQ